MSLQMLNENSKSRFYKKVDSFPLSIDSFLIKDYRPHMLLIKEYLCGLDVENGIRDHDEVLKMADEIVLDSVEE